MYEMMQGKNSFVQKNNNRLVILLHGIMKSSKKMQGLANFLKRNNFDILNIDYPSTKFPLEDLVEIIHTDISRALELNYQKIYFIGFSMGGLLARAYLNKYRIENLANIVFIGTPNHGSEVADFFNRFKFFRFIFGPAGQQLVTNQDSFIHVLGSPYYEFGVIAGDFSVNLLLSKIIKKPNDGKVSVESTKLDGMKDHLVLSTSHPFMIRNRKVWEYTLNFMLHSSFCPSERSEA
jgi:pimeloyl-ACP methyl ester carboxylesterase